MIKNPNISVATRSTRWINPLMVIGLIMILEVAQAQFSTCRVLSFQKYSNSLCTNEVAKSVEEAGYLGSWNNLIASSRCDYQDNINTGRIKLRVDCLNSRSIRFRYYNFFGNDEICV